MSQFAEAIHGAMTAHEKHLMSQRIKAGLKRRKEMLSNRTNHKRFRRESFVKRRY